MDRRFVLLDNYKSGYDFLLHILHQYHKIQDKDQYISDWHKLLQVDIQR